MTNTSLSARWLMTSRSLRAASAIGKSASPFSLALCPPVAVAMTVRPSPKHSLCVAMSSMKPWAPPWARRHAAIPRINNEADNTAAMRGTTTPLPIDT
jgi:hypothetical protein